MQRAAVFVDVFAVRRVIDDDEFCPESAKKVWRKLASGTVGAIDSKFITA